MEKIKRFFECLLPVTVCNLECSYCYIIQENRRAMQKAPLKYSPQHIAKALRKQRVGGTCLISICGAGETLSQPELVEIIKYILDEGHYVNVTTNGTLSSQLKRIVEICDDNIKRLHFSFSFHYIELIKKNWVDLFFENVNMVKEAGASILVQINLCDEYISKIDEIKSLCLERIGAYPQVALTRNEKTKPMSIFTSKTNDEYIKEGKKFDSPLFDFTVENFQKKRTEFCYAGDWSCTLNLSTGELCKCYSNKIADDIFQDIDSPIDFEAIGNGCPHPYCVNSSHFLSLGVIPSLDTPTYSSLRNRICENQTEWMTLEMKNFTSSKLSESNQEYSERKKKKINKLSTGKLTFRGRLSQFKFYQKLHDIKENFHG